MLTQNDLQEIQKIVELVIGIKLEGRLTTIEEKIELLPTRGEYLQREQQLYGEVQAMRDEQTLLSQTKSQVDDHDIRLTRLETHPVITTA